MGKGSPGPELKPEIHGEHTFLSWDADLARVGEIWSAALALGDCLTFRCDTFPLLD